MLQFTLYRLLRCKFCLKLLPHRRERQHRQRADGLRRHLPGIGEDAQLAAAGAAGKVMGYAFDANDVEIQAVKDGVLTGMVVQDPFGIGYKSAMFAVDALENRQVPKAVDTGATIVTKANIDDPKVHKLLYPNQ